PISAAQHDAGTAVDLDDVGCHVRDVDAFVGPFDVAGEPTDDPRRTDDGPHGVAHLPAAIGPQCDLRREQLHELVDVSAGDGSEEPLDDPALLLAVGLVPRPPRPYVLPGP